MLYSVIASNVLNRENPLPTTSSLRRVAVRVAQQDVARGMVADAGGRLQLVEAVADGSIRLFGSPIWRTPSQLDAVYDLSEMAMPPVLRDTKSAGEPGTGSGVPTVPGTTQKTPPIINNALTGENRRLPGGIGPPIIVGKGESPMPAEVSVKDPTIYQKAAQKLSDGIGELHFGMSWTEVNKKFTTSFRDSGYEDLPVAGEFKPAEVRYIWVRLSSIEGNNEFIEYLSLLEPFKSCLGEGTQSYVTFLFQNNELIRVSSRFFDDCRGREELFQRFVVSLGLSLVLPSNQNRVALTIGSTNMTWSIFSDVDTLDVWKQGSPVPADF